MKKLGMFLLCMFLCGCSSNVSLKKQTFTIELGKDVYANPALYVKEQSERELKNMSVNPVSVGIVKSKNRFVSMGYDYLLIGEYDFEISHNNKKVPFRIKIKDTQPPTILKKVEELTVSKGTYIDWSTYFEAEDISGVEYNSSQDELQYVGEHYIEVTISDHFGNATSRSVKVTVE